MSLQEAFDAGFEAVKAYVDRELASFEVRLRAVEAREPAQGEPGRDGVSLTVDDVAPLIHEEVVKAFSAIPAPKDGAPGRDGADGKDGRSVTVDDVTPLISAEVTKAMSAIPPPKDGRDGVDGKNGADGRDGRDGVDGAPGRDGADVTAGILAHDGSLILTLSNGEAKTVGVVVGKDGAPGADGAPGRDGRDGFDLKGFDAELLPDGRTILLKFEDGSDISFKAEIAVPTMIYRGVFQEGQPYERGDTVTWAGSLWHCDADTSEKPGDGSKSWTLAAKRGRDGSSVVREQRDPAKPVKVGA